MRRSLSLLLVATFILPGLHAYAETVGVPRAERPWTVGAGVVWRDRVYQDFDSGERTRFFPLVLFEGQRFFIRASNLGWKIIDDGIWEVSLLGEFWGDGYESSDSDFLDGMDDRDPSFAAGGQVSWRAGRFGLELTATADATDNSSGVQFRTLAAWQDQINAWFYQLKGGIVWYDSDFIEYYFGVEADEALPGRPAYDPDSESSYRAQVTVGYRRPQSKWLFLAGSRYELYGGEVDDSPIVEDDGELTLFGGFGYIFGN